MNYRYPYALIPLVAVLFCCSTGREISYRRDVLPTLERNCFACHTPPRGEGYRKAGLDLTTYETLMRGSLYGPVISPGDSQTSVLNMLVEGRADPSMRMPHGRSYPLTDEEIGILRQWVEQGAKNN
jgi:hypothetical protein